MTAIVNDRMISGFKFEFYMPELLSFPMKIQLGAQNLDQLKKLVKEFTDRQFTSDVLIIGNVAYIEYVPSPYKDLKIPEENWEIKSWRARKNK